MTDGARYELISADSHVIEPPDLFESRLPASLRDQAPKLVTADGVSSWVVEDVMPAPLPASAVTGSGYDVPGGVSAGATFADIMPALHDPAERLKAQFTDSVDAEVLYGFPYLWDAIKQADDARAAPGVRPGLQRLARRVLLARAGSPARRRADPHFERRGRRHRDASRRRRAEHAGLRARRVPRRRRGCDRPRTRPDLGRGRGDRAADQLPLRVGRRAGARPPPGSPPA